MRHFTSTHKQQHANLLARLQQAHGHLEQTVEGCNVALGDAFAAVELAINGFNEHAANAFAAVEIARDLYNETVTAAKDFVEEVRSDAQSYFDDRSETWQEGEAGDAYQEWIDALDEIDLAQADVDAPDEIELPDRPEIALPEAEAIDAFENIRQGVDE